LSLRLEQIERQTQGQDVNVDAKAALGQVERLVTMVEDLLTTWRSSSDRTLATFSVQKLINDETRRWHDLYQSAGRTIDIECDSSLMALGTVGVQELVLSVLLDNSLKYGAGTTFMRATDYQTWVLIEVGDEGPGIREEMKNTLMSPGATSGGTGLGLAWARRQVAADGGRLELRSLHPAIFGVFLIADRQSVSAI
jgi:signal transduction histidine kinase